MPADHPTRRGPKSQRFSLPIGATFHRLTIVGPAVPRRRPTGEGCAIYPCRCECGRRVEVEYRGLVRGITKSCGCLQREWATRFKTKHGGAGTRLHRIWRNILTRCNLPTCPRYKDYGGRGIGVCRSWAKDFGSFRRWALANGYRDDLTIDRIDNDGDYRPSNCRWTTILEQCSNTRRNRYIAAFGEVKSLSAWARDIRCRVTSFAIKDRMNKGWSAEVAISTPPLMIPPVRRPR